MAVAESVEQQADSFIHSPHKLLIDGDWVEAASGKTFETLNPATEESSLRSPTVRRKTSTRRSRPLAGRSPTTPRGGA
jgi:hypothetical protein